MIYFSENELLVSFPVVTDQAFQRLVLYNNDTPINAQAPLLAFLYDDQYTFDISGVLQNAGLWNTATPNLPEAIEVYQTDSIKSFVLKTSNIGSDVYTGTTAINVLNGKIRDDIFDMYPQETFADAYLQNKFLTNRLFYEKVRLSQRMFLHFLSNWEELPTNLSLSVSFCTATGESDFQVIQVLDEVTLNQVYTIAFQPLSFLPYYKGTERLLGIKIGITSGDDILIQKKLEIEYTNTLEELELIYLNYYGLWESLRVAGDLKTDIEVKTDAIVIKNKKQDVNSSFTESLSIQLGEHNSHHTKAILADLAHSDNIYLLRNNHLVRLNKNLKTITAYQSSTRFDNPTLDFTLTYQY